ncbi:hypothetical protein RIF29_43264 [Crotalaria pallida]
MLRGVEKKRRSGDSRIGQPFELLLNPRAGKRQPGELKHLSEAVECCTLDGESPVAESITSLRSDPSSMGHVESRVNQQGPPCKAKYSWVTDSEVVPSEPTDVEESADELWLGVKCHSSPELAGSPRNALRRSRSRSDSETMGDKLHRREGNSPDHQLRPLNDRSVIKEMNGAKRSAEAVGCKNGSVGERSALEGRTRASSGGRSGSENVGLSNANVGENPMPRKPKGSSARFVHGGCPCFFRVRRGRENASSQCSSTRRYGAEVTHAILPGKARTTFNKRVPVPETDTDHVWGLTPAQCRKVKEVGDLMTGEPATEAPVNGGRNYNERLGEIDMSVKMRTTCTWTERPYEASLFPGIGFGLFLRSLGGGRRRPPSGGARAISEIPLWKS